MGTVWDRTVEVINGRTGMLAGIAALTLWLPAVLREALVFFAGIGDASPATTPAPGASGVVLVLLLITAALTILGQLALIAVASDPATTRGEALRIAARRLPVAIGLALLLALLVFAALVPVIVPLAAVMPNPAGMTPETMRIAMAGIAPGTRAFMGLYLLAFGIAMLWLSARLALLNPVIVNEQAGTGSFARSFALTRGLVWKIVALAILFGIVTIVVMAATQSVVGIMFRLILGGDNLGLVALLTAAVVAVVTSAVTIVWTSFLAQLYIATRGAPAAG